IIRRQVVAEFVALIDASPDFSGHRFNRQPNWITQSGGVLPRIFSIKIANRYRSADRSFARVDVRIRAYGDEQMFPVGRNGDRARRVSAGGQIQQMLLFAEAL